jgi:F0F1-type ATP synthase membrane subunit b/b'
LLCFFIHQHSQLSSSVLQSADNRQKEEVGRIKARRERELERKKANKVAPPDSALKKNKRAKVVSTKGSVLKPHSHGHELVQTPA